MTCTEFYQVAIVLIATTSIAAVLNTLLQFADIVVCRLIDCGSKNHEIEHVPKGQPKDYPIKE